MPSKFLGVSRAEIRTILNIDKSNHRRNAKFLNKAKLTPIRARDVHVRHQIDLMDMSRKGYDLQKIGQDGVKRAKQLPLYQRILNNDPKEVIAYKTPFEIYFVRNCNAFRESRLQEEILPSAGRVRPTKNYNPPRGGDCQFAALLHQAKRMGILRSPETMRKEIVEYLKSNPFDSNGFPLLEHLANDEVTC